MKIIRDFWKRQQGEVMSEKPVLPWMEAALGLAKAVVKYFGDGPINPLLDGDIALRQMARNLIAAPAPLGQAVSLDVYQQDWQPGFASFRDDGEIQEGAHAHVTLNLGSLLSAVQMNVLDSRDLPYLIAETLMHEAIHCLESWARVEFSEDRVEELLTKYRDKYARATIWEYTGSEPKEAGAAPLEEKDGQLGICDQHWGTDDDGARYWHGGKHEETSFCLNWRPIPPATEEKGSGA